jgi:hypothetical protein
MRFKFSEMSVERIVLALWRRINAVPDKISWNFSIRALDNRSALKKFKDIHKGEKCFLIANGPSLNLLDLNKIKNEITFGLNRIYLNYANMGFEPTYLVCVNKLVLEQFAEEIKKQKMPLFINWQSRKHYEDIDNVLFVERNFFSERFSENISSSLTGAATVTYAALQIIYYMGFESVVIVGMDHNFAFKGTPNKAEVRKEDRDINHFSPNYFPKGVKWETPDLLSSDYYYSIANNRFLEDGRHIYDATVDGKCNIFTKIDYDLAVSEKIIPAHLR